MKSLESSGSKTAMNRLMVLQVMGIVEVKEIRCDRSLKTNLTFGGAVVHHDSRQAWSAFGAKDSQNHLGWQEAAK